VRRSKLPDAVFLGSAGFGLLVAYGVSPGTLFGTAAALSAPVIAFHVVRTLNVTDLSDKVTDLSDKEEKEER
jgi:hypothetical protein